jgi:hypothetical protein
VAAWPFPFSKNRIAYRAPNIEPKAKMKVYLDDVREAPVGWMRVYWPDEAIALLESGAVTEISLDHDLGDDTRGTGYDVVRWIEEAVFTRHFVAPSIHIHSANPVGRDRMTRGIAAIERLRVRSV